jgi:hypothetical protein
MLGAVGGREHSITNIVVADGGAETGFFLEELAPEVAIVKG